MIFGSGVLRGVLLPAFLLYTFSGIFESDLFIVLFVLVISVLSGYLNTSAYQWAAAAAPESAKAPAASIMNISFQLSIYTSFVVQALVLVITHFTDGSDEGAEGSSMLC